MSAEKVGVTALPATVTVGASTDQTQEDLAAGAKELQDFFSEWSKRFPANKVAAMLAITIPGKDGGIVGMAGFHGDYRGALFTVRAVVNRLSSDGLDSFVMLGTEGGQSDCIFITPEKAFTNRLVGMAYAATYSTFTDPDVVGSADQRIVTNG